MNDTAQHLVRFDKWLDSVGRSRIWGWRMRKQGLPARTINGKPYAVLPDADVWLMAQSSDAAFGPEPSRPSHRKEIVPA
jgi:hypothetical protein